MKTSDLVIRWLEDRFAEESKNGRAKYEQLSRIIVSAFREGVLVPGAKLPSEQVISRNLRVSLATVRKCFTHLAQSGVISREHGRGTFVLSGELGVSDLWHYRFRDPGKPGFMAIYNHILERHIITDRDIGSLFGDAAASLVYIERAVNIGVRFVCYSQVYLPADKFARIMDEPVTELERVNLKDVLTREFHAPTLRMDQFLRIAPVPDNAWEIMNVEPGAATMLLRVVGYTFEDQPISCQRIWIPETEYELNLPTTAGAVRRRDAAPSRERSEVHG
jgi:GntR family transcriptional regulator